jgi:ectoine hydroxylase-related dioxygenase (phytanoyl-CoA dioxygenase family)
VAGTAPVRHRLNTDFEWVDHVGPFRIIDDAQARSYDELGYFVLHGAFSEATLDALVAEIDPVEHQQEEELRKLEDGRFFIARADEITFTTHLVRQSEVLRNFARSPLLSDLCADLIGPDVRLYWDQAVYKKPDTNAVFPWHQDNGYAFLLPQQYLTCWIPLTDATEENGCPWVVPGLHRMGTLAHRISDIGLVCLAEPADAVAVPVERGSMVVFSSLTPHSTGPNMTDAVRKAYIVQFAPDGAQVVRDDGDKGLTRIPADAEDRQFLIRRDGAPLRVST